MYTDGKMLPPPDPYDFDFGPGGACSRGAWRVNACNGLMFASYLAKSLIRYTIAPIRLRWCPLSR